ncbi:hypothetical protein LCGC14_1612350 [marine sediment metagenome]|uniref:Uncharacterized protein n=1 Tax=marine sediment metagenome TaxID=412755 RepID=A0A0F9KNN3_9ZZZZ
MNKKRLQKLAGVLNEQADPNQKFVGRSVVFTRQEIYETLNDNLEDEILDGRFPEGTRFKVQDITDKIAQQYADDFIKALYDSAGERFVERHMEITEKTLKKIKPIRRRAIGLKRQQQR